MADSPSQFCLLTVMLCYPSDGRAGRSHVLLGKVEVFQKTDNMGEVIFQNSKSKSPNHVAFSVGVLY